MYYQAGMPTLSVVNPTLSRHCLHLFSKVGNGSMHLLEFLVRKRWDKILKGITKLKSGKMDSVGANMP